MRFTDCLNDTTKNRGLLAFAVDPGLVRTSMTEMQLLSDAGKTYLPNIQDLFDNGVNIPPSCAAALIADIAAGHSTHLLADCCAVSMNAVYSSRRCKISSSETSS